MPPLCRRLHGNYEGIIPRVRASSATTPGFRTRTGGVQPPAKPEASRFPCKELPHMPVSLTTPGWADTRNNASVHVAFRKTERRRHPRLSSFRGSMAGLCGPLPTLRRSPRGLRRTARGRCGLLLLHRGGLSPPTPCRFRRRTGLLEICTNVGIVGNCGQGGRRGAVVRL